jgi:hypothetical protein
MSNPDHECRTLPDRFSGRNLCLQCGKEFVPKNSEYIKAMEDILSLIFAEEMPLASNEGIVVFCTNKYEELKRQPS